MRIDLYVVINGGMVGLNRKVKIRCNCWLVKKLVIKGVESEVIICRKWGLFYC